MKYSFLYAFGVGCVAAAVLPISWAGLLLVFLLGAVVGMTLFCRVVLKEWPKF